MTGHLFDLDHALRRAAWQSEVRRSKEQIDPLHFAMRRFREVIVDQTNEVREYLARVAAQPQAMARIGHDATEADQPATESRSDFILVPTNLSELQQYIEQVSRYWTDWLSSLVYLTLVAPTEADKRFAGDAWYADPRYYALQHGYRAYANFLQHAVDTSPADEATKEQLRFNVRQIVDAMSPANFFATNPEAIQLALETQGESLTRGAELFLQDAAKGRISMSDENAFEVGRNLALTVGDVIFENELIQVIQYQPLTAQIGQRPLLMIPPCINKFYILDLQPENSLVRHALEQGIAVFMLSWRNITPELGHLTWDDYLERGVLQAVDVVLDVSGAERINALGFCIGGALLASAVALMQQWNDNKIASLTLLTTMLDYGETGELGLLVTEKSVTKREAAIGSGGVMPGKELALTFSSLRANDLIWPYVANSYLKGKAPPAFDLLYWNADATNLPGPMFTWYVRNTYLENKLREPGGTIQCGLPVDLSVIEVPAYIYASREDHLVPWRTCYESTRLLSGDKTFVLGASGHIAGVINAPAKRKRNYWVNDNLHPIAEEWYSHAQSVPGSWWPHWSAWLKQRSGEPVAAPKRTGNDLYRRIELAPGRYVKQRAD
ncbi:MAG TPA: class I poly(R)-hydroxyalkanoic acid synthase [Burkholderiaceae bacterium]|nr:class I poly(R)-hydroxyalkanoic acid synthase [Burkholderiaceae bacterium]